MKAITLWQPYSWCIAVGLKHTETRSWRTSYRGPIAIAAAARRMTRDDLDWWQRLCREDDAICRAARDGHAMTFGFVEAVVVLDGCYPTSGVLNRVRGPGGVWRADPTDYRLGDHGYGRWDWVLTDVHRLRDPFLCYGKQGLWEWTPPADFGPHYYAEEK